MYVKLVTALAAWSALTAAWPAGCAFSLATYGSGLPIGIALGRREPGLLRERLAGPFQRGQAGWDKALLPVIMLCYFGWLGFMAPDAARFNDALARLAPPGGSLQSFKLS